VCHSCRGPHLTSPVRHTMSRKRRRSTSPDFFIDSAKTLQPEKKKLKLDYPGRRRYRLLRLLQKRKQIIFPAGKESLDSSIISLSLYPANDVIQSMQPAPVPKSPTSPAVATPPHSKQGPFSDKASVPVAAGFPPSLNRQRSASHKNAAKTLQRVTKLKLMSAHKQHTRRRQRLVRWLQTQESSAEPTELMTLIITSNVAPGGSYNGPTGMVAFSIVQLSDALTPVQTLPNPNVSKLTEPC
jgi:hypothetical protein